MGVKGLSKKIKRERTHEHRQQSGDCSGERVDGSRRDNSEVNSNRKNTIQYNKKFKKHN